MVYYAVVERHCEGVRSLVKVVIMLLASQYQSFRSEVEKRTF